MLMLLACLLAVQQYNDYSPKSNLYKQTKKGTRKYLLSEPRDGRRLKREPYELDLSRPTSLVIYHPRDTTTLVATQEANSKSSGGLQGRRGTWSTAVWLAVGVVLLYL